jgi:hypothetical protein
VAIDPRSYLDEVDLPAGSPTSKVADKPRRGADRGGERKSEAGENSGG